MYAFKKHLYNEDNFAECIQFGPLDDWLVFYYPPDFVFDTWF